MDAMKSMVYRSVQETNDVCKRRAPSNSKKNLRHLQLCVLGSRACQSVGWCLPFHKLCWDVGWIKANDPWLGWTCSIQVCSAGKHSARRGRNRLEPTINQK